MSALYRALLRLWLRWEVYELEHHLRDAGRTRKGESGPVLTPQQIAADRAKLAQLRARIALLQPPLRRTARGTA